MQFQMHIVHIIAGIQETCGVSQFVVHTARAQQAMGYDVTIITTMTCGFPVEDLRVVLTEKPKHALKIWKSNCMGKQDFSKNSQSAYSSCALPLIVHIHSLWTLYSHQACVWCRYNGIPYTYSPHGGLTRWAMRFHWWKKYPAWWLYQRRDLSSASAFHVTAQEEEKDVRRFGFRQPVAIAPLGAEIGQCANVAKSRDVLFVGRIHPTKNLDGLIRAWQLVKEDKTFPAARLIIAGSDDFNLQIELVRLAKELGLRTVDFSKELEFGKKQIQGGGEVPVSTFERKLAECKDADVVFTGPVYSAAKDWMYARAYVTVLPSHSENFGGVVIESLAVGTPCIATKGTPWAQLPEHNCGWWVEDSVAELRDILAQALQLQNSQYAEMSRNAHRLVEEKYSWRESAQTLINAYSAILSEKRN